MLLSGGKRILAAKVDSDPAFFGEWLKLRRQGLDLTQAELAQRAGCSAAGLRKIETGERRPSKELAALLAAALEIAPDKRVTFVRVARGELNLERLGPVSGERAAPRPLSAALPVWPTPFIGRVGELTALGELLFDPNCRLLTIIGPGGIGKTRLAVEVATRVIDRFADGVCFVPLAQQNSPAFLVPALADALGITLQGQTDAQTQLLNYLRARQMLLIVDNMEHLLAGVPLLAAIVAQSPGVTLLVTSRERLNLMGEWVYELEGLPVPAGEDTPQPESCVSVVLFIQNARRASSVFSLHEGDLTCVARICRRLEGTPLGIELAAAWVAVLSPCEIAGRIEKSFDFLTTTLRDVPERQRSLRAAFDYSWGLLPPDERCALSRLAVFRGGFDHAAAEHVAGATLPILLALISKSLIRRRESGRYDMHEVVRQYALASLSEGAEADATRDRHSDYYLTLLRSHERDLKGPGQRAALARLTEEIGNIRAGWAWAVTREEFDLIGSALRSYGWMCEVGGRLQEGVAELGLVVWALHDRELNDVETTALGQALAQQGLLCFRLGRFEQAFALFNESLSLLRPLGNPATLVDPLFLSGIMLHLCGDYESSRARLREAAAYARAGNDLWFSVYAHYNLGYLAALTGQVQAGYVMMRHSLAAWRATADPRSISLGLNFLAPTAMRLGHYEQAVAWLEESIALSSELGDRWGLGTAWRQYGAVELARGNIEAAKTHLAQSLDAYRGFVTGYDLLHTNIHLGECALAEGDDVAAGRILADALREARAEGIEALTLQAVVGLVELKLRRGRHAEALGLAVAVMNQPVANYEVKTRASAVRVAARGHLDDAQGVAAEEWGRALSLEEMVKAVLGD